MNTINDILKESLLLEAIKIDNGKDAIELIKNNKLGVKINNSFTNFFKRSDKASLDYLQHALQTLIRQAGPNDAVFAIQLAANKVNAFEMNSVINNGSFIEVIKNRNKAWAKENEDFKNAISFNGDWYEDDEWEEIRDWLEAEKDNHGKARKGSGNKEMGNTLFNDGTWTLQIPDSFQGAKALSFYGKKGEKQSPTKWCTRVQKKYYDYYSHDSPLYIIRNWETGDAYQLAFLKDHIEFLDKDDESGDEITKGDLSKIPDGLLEKIKKGNKSLKDYKHKKMYLEKKEKNEPLSKGSKFKDPSWNIEKARWGKEVNIGKDIAKRVWENFYERETDQMSDYMINNKSPSSYVKHEGSWGIKYYFKNDPDFFILMYISRGMTRMMTGYYHDDDGDIEELTAEEFSANVDDFDYLYSIAKEDSGYKVSRGREDNEEMETYKKLNAVRSSANVLKTKLEHNLTKNLNKTLSNYMNGVSCIVRASAANTNSGGFAPYSLEVAFIRNGKTLARFILLKNNMKYNYDNNSPYKEHMVWKKMLEDSIGKNKAIDLDRDIINTVNNTMKNYYKEAIKDENLRDRREEARTKERGLHFESYFPY